MGIFLQIWGVGLEIVIICSSCEDTAVENISRLSLSLFQMHLKLVCCRGWRESTTTQFYHSCYVRAKDAVGKQTVKCGCLDVCL